MHSDTGPTCSAEAAMARATKGHDQEDVSILGTHTPPPTQPFSEVLSAIFPFFGSPSPNQAPSALRHICFNFSVCVKRYFPRFLQVIVQIAFLKDRY